MKTIPVVFLFALLIFGCKSQDQGLEGDYFGDFGHTGMLKIHLEQEAGNRVKGYSLHRGLSCSLEGTITEPELLLKENGDVRFSGNFNFLVSGDTLQGYWSHKGDSIPLLLIKKININE